MEEHRSSSPLLCRCLRSPLPYSPLPASSVSAPYLCHQSAPGLCYPFYSRASFAQGSRAAAFVYLSPAHQPLSAAPYHLFSNCRLNLEGWAESSSGEIEESPALIVAYRAELKKAGFRMDRTQACQFWPSISNLPVVQPERPACRRD